MIDSVSVFSSIVSKPSLRTLSPEAELTERDTPNNLSLAASAAQLHRYLEHVSDRHHLTRVPRPRRGWLGRRERAPRSSPCKPNAGQVARSVRAEPARTCRGSRKA
jgi:hypothetical protein